MCLIPTASLNKYLVFLTNFLSLFKSPFFVRLINSKLSFKKISDFLFTEIFSEEKRLPSQEDLSFIRLVTDYVATQFEL